MAATLTLTGTAGPGETLTAGVFTNVLWFTIDTLQNTITFYQNGVIRIISVAAATTVTSTKSGANWTLTIS